METWLQKVSPCHDLTKHVYLVQNIGFGLYAEFTPFQ